MTPAKNTFTVFYSWQSDLPEATNRGLIRRALRSAASRLEEESTSELHIVIDEATRDVAGSPNIPLTILQKIRKADAFVADVSTINVRRVEGERAMPNPNVMVELGYAVAHLGWNRIVMLLNHAFGSEKDAPFDVDRQRLSPFRAEPRKDPSLGKKGGGNKELEALAYAALKLIVVHDPTRPDDEDFDAPAVKRRRDMAAIQSMLETIHLGTFEQFLEDLGLGKIIARIYSFWHRFNAVIGSRTFHLYDDVLSRMVKQLRDAWSATLSVPEGYFRSNRAGTAYKFHMPGDRFPSEDSAEAWRALQKARSDLATAHDQLITHIRANYVELDVAACSAAAWEWYEKYEAIDEPRPR